MATPYPPSHPAAPLSGEPGWRDPASVPARPLPRRRVYLRRYADGTRMNHWFIALMFVLAALSGLAFFHPSLFFFTNLFGGGQWTRILHPFLGVLMVLGFVFLYVQVWRGNRREPNDAEWMRNMGDMFRGDKSRLPPIGKYNPAQKMVFWLMTGSLAVLFITGFMFWRPWFAPYLPIVVIRAAALLHSIAAVVLVMSVIVHVYAAIWVKGTMRAMTRGTVTEDWARQNHPLWHRDMTKGKAP